MPTLPVVLTIAGSDNSAGAGAQADLKTISALGGYGVTAITCVVAEVPGKVSAVHPIPPAIVAEYGDWTRFREPPPMVPKVQRFVL